MKINNLDKNTIVYVDECGIDEHYHRTHGRAPRGERIYADVPGKKYKRTKIIAGYYNGKAIAPFQYDGTTNAGLVDGWVETYLLNELPEKTTIVMDRASFHKESTIVDIVEDASCDLLFLPAYSPDLNPIEHALWANLKKYLRNYSKNYNLLEDALMDFFRLK
jgi:transposase